MGKESSLCDILGRPLDDGDYVLVILRYRYSDGDGLEDAYIGRIAYGKIQVVIDGKVVKPNVHAYKLEADKQLLYDYWKTGRSIEKLYLYYGVNYRQTGTFTELLGRSLSLGDFVLCRRSTKYLTKDSLLYGVVVDTSHILTERGIRVKVGIVYKIEKPTKEEVLIHKKILTSFQNEQTLAVKGVNEGLRKGNLYKNGNKVYVYCGDYKLKVVRYNKLQSNNFISNQVWDLMGKDRFSLYIQIDCTKKLCQAFLDKLLSGNFTQEDISDYLSCKGSKLKLEYPVSLPHTYVFDKNTVLLGNYYGNINLDGFNFDYLWDRKDNRWVGSLTFVEQE